MLAGLRYAVIALLLHGSAVIADADDIHVDVTREPENRYTFELSFLVDAPVDAVFSVLTDFNHLHTLNSTIQSSRVLPFNQPEIIRVEVISRNCVLVFCKTLTRVEDVRMVNNQSIETVLVPTMSNFKEGDTLWTFTQEDNSTRVTMQGYMVPDFWVPPLIGPHTIKKQMRRQLREAASKVTELANISNDD